MWQTHSLTHRHRNRFIICPMMLMHWADKNKPVHLSVMLTWHSCTVPSSTQLVHVHSAACNITHAGLHERDDVHIYVHSLFVSPLLTWQMEIGKFDPSKIVTSKNFILKHCTRDYVWEITLHANFASNWYNGGFSRNRQNITTLWLFLLFCPVLFSITRPGRTAGQIFTL